MRKILMIALAMALASCALPNTTVRSGAVRPSLAIKGAPEEALLFVDGLQVGLAAQFDGIARVLNVEEGAHLIEIRVGNRVVHSEKFVISTGEARTLSVGGGK
jgi:hypothetical protein